VNGPAPPEGYQLAFEEARRGLEDQERAVGELRARAGALIAAAAITTSFFGTQAIGDDDPSAWAWHAIGAFVLVAMTVLAVLWPRRDWEFDLSPAQFVATYLEPANDPPLDMPVIHRDLALHMGTSARRKPGATACAHDHLQSRRDPADTRGTGVDWRPHRHDVDCM
jgi:hypothetical protein